MEYKFIFLFFISGVAVGMAIAITIALRATKGGTYDKRCRNLNCGDANLRNNNCPGLDNRLGKDGKQ